MKLHEFSKKESCKMKTKETKKSRQARMRGNKYAVGNPGGSPPTKYKPEFAKQAFKLCLLGATDIELAAFFEVSVRTIDQWKLEHKEFTAALKTGKHEADSKVAHKLYERAIGYTSNEVTVQSPNKKKVVTKEVAPDVTAQIFWLKNRQKENWRDKHSYEFDYEKLTDEQLNYMVEKLKCKQNGQE